mmetsp:Transcript_16235/g.49410  ORF Transcript_16235/g.49410 Transcript_16235/m.49410 type:complete len:253 (+) Transcript_16235:395-1153(+)
MGERHLFHLGKDATYASIAHILQRQRLPGLCASHREAQRRYGWGGRNKIGHEVMPKMLGASSECQTAAHDGLDLRRVTEKGRKLGHLAKGAGVQVGTLSRLGERLEHERLEGVLVLVPVDLHAAQHGELRAVIPNARACGNLSEHRLLHHRVHLVGDEGHVIGCGLDSAQLRVELHLDVVELQVVHVAKVRRRVNAWLAQRLVRTDRSAAGTRAGDDACALDRAHATVISHANMRREDDQQLALIRHVVSIR